MSKLVPVEIIANKILDIRGKKVMLDKDLAYIYDVPTKRLNEQVRRNLKRFPEDFMFQLSRDEVIALRSQFATLNSQSLASFKRGKHSKYLPYVFTEQGVAMLSSVLNSERAIQVNIRIMRAFVQIKGFLLTHRELALRLEKLERHFGEHDEKIKVIFEAIKQLLAKPTTEEDEKRQRIGFHRER